MRINAVLKAIIRLLAMAVVFIATLEGMARLDDYVTWQAPFFGDYSPEILSTTDEMGHHGRPEAQYQKWKLNRFGLRNPEITLAKPAGLERVLLLGASELFGLYETPGQELAAQLQGILNAKYPGRFQVINGSHFGMSLPRIQEYYSRLLIKLDPSFVVIYPTPAFYLDDLPPKPVGAQSSAPGQAKAFELRIKSKIVNALKKFVPVGINKEIYRLLWWKNRRASGADYAFRAVPPERLGLFKNDLESLLRTVADSGAKVILATHANRFAVDFSAEDLFHMYAWLLNYPRADPAVILAMENQARSVVLGVAREFGTTVVDLSSQLGGQSKAFADFVHFTDHGAGIAADAIGRAIIAAENGQPK